MTETSTNWEDIVPGSKVKFEYLPTKEIFEATAHADWGDDWGDGACVLGWDRHVFYDVGDVVVRLISVTPPSKALPSAYGSRVYEHWSKVVLTLMPTRVTKWRDSPDTENELWVSDEGGFWRPEALARQEWTLVYDAGEEDRSA